MPNLSTIPAPGPDCAPWRSVCDGCYRRFGVSGMQFAYPDGRVLTFYDWDAE